MGFNPLAIGFGTVSKQRFTANNLSKVTTSIYFSFSEEIEKAP